MIAAALLASQPLYVYADTQISLEGPSGQNVGDAGNNNNQMNSSNGLPMAGTEGTQMGGSNQGNTQSPNGSQTNSNVPGGAVGNGNAANSNVGQVPGAGNPGEQNNTGSTGTAQNPGTGSTGASPSQGPGSGNNSAPSPQNPENTGTGSSQQVVRDGSSPEKALLYVTKEYKGNSQSLSKPTVQSEGAYLYNVTTGETLFEKNAASHFYPASITKLMTALLVLENCKLDDVVTYHSSAVDQLESGAVKLGLTEGDQLTVEDSLYALLLKSANDVAAGLAEHVAGSQEAFAKMMNDRAKAIGCRDTNFVNPHGLNDSNHYTTPHDMALIAAEAFKNNELCKINSTLTYKIPALKNVTTERTITLGHKMFFKNDSRYYEGVIGGKTGYTSKAGNTLVTCVEREGTRLVAVVLKSRQTHYQDTKAMLDYGFWQAFQNKEQSGQIRQGEWKKNEYGWYFVNETGNFVKNIWMNIDDNVYLFDTDGYMATGWKNVNKEAWYYFGQSGMMKKKCWVQTNGQWYYLTEDGSLLTNGVTPDGYKVDQFGIWQQS